MITTDTLKKSLQVTGYLNAHGEHLPEFHFIILINQTCQEKMVVGTSVTKWTFSATKGFLLMF